MSRRSTVSSGPRWDEIIQTGRGYRPRRRMPRGLGKTLLVAFLMLLVLSLIAAGVFAYVQVRVKGGNTEIANLDPRPKDEPLNVLILGSDSREGLSAEDLKKYDPEGIDRRSGRRADTIILLHIDEKREKVLLVHFPRDLRVTYPNGQVGRINGAFQKGASNLVETVKKFSGVPINHYVEVNFAGFNNIVNTLGGVEVYFERPIKEPDSGLNVPKGCVNIEGDQALAFVRVRKIDNDFGRIARQQLFVKLMMQKLTEAGTLLNPVKVVKLVNDFSKHVVTDQELSLSEIKSLAVRLKGMNAGKIDMRVVPSSGATIKGVSYVIANEKQTKELFEAVRDRRPLPDYGRTGVNPIDPSDVELVVLNGTGVEELAKQEAQKLRGDGFQELSTGNASAHPKTTVYFKDGNDQKARFVAERYGASVKPLPPTIEVETDLALVLGADYAQGKATPAPSPSVTKAKPGQKAPAPPKPLIHAC